MTERSNSVGAISVCYIAGPMSGLPEFNYPAFTQAAAALRAQGRSVISPHELHGGDISHPYVYYLRHDLRALLKCDEITLLPGWEKSRGARLEIAVAEALEMPISTIDDLLANEEPA